MKHRHDDTIDRTLSALAAATPPNGMEARIQQRLQYRAQEGHVARRLKWRPDRAWWLGMLTGAALAGLLCSVVLIGSWRVHHERAEQAAKTAAAPASKPISKRILPVSSGATESAPCAHPATVGRMRHRESPAKQTSAEPQRPVQERALTREEQQLVRLVHVARPAELTDLSFEARAQIAQQESTAFQKFFTPPPPPPQDTGVTE